MAKPLEKLITKYFSEKIGEFIPTPLFDGEETPAQLIMMDLLKTWERPELYKKLTKRYGLDKSTAQAFLEEFEPHREEFLNSEIGKILYEMRDYEMKMDEQE